MSVFFPIAGISVNLLLILGAGALVGFLSGLLGVGGGFLMTPMLMFLGIPPTVAAASDSCQIVAASSSGLAAHLRLGNVDLRMGAVLLAGGLTGGVLGVQLIKVLLAIGEADAFIAVTYVLLLGTVGGLIFVTSLRSLRQNDGQVGAKSQIRRFSLFDKLPWQVDFPRSKVRHCLLVPFLLCTVVGVLAAIMGVGGGFLMVPVMVYLLGIPAHVAVGTSLLPILLTSADVAILQASTNHTVDVLLAILLAVASAITAQIGARLSRVLKSEQLMIILATLALLVGGKMLFDLIVTPSSLLAPVRTHGSAHVRTNTRVTGVGQQKVTTDATETFHTTSVTAPSTATQDMSFRIAPETVQIGLLYSGAHIQVEGMAQSDSKVVAVIRGGETEEEFYKKVKAGPIWVNGSRIFVSGVPELFYRFSSGTLHEFLNREVIDHYQLDEESIKRQMRIVPEGNRNQIITNWLELKANEGTYALNRHALTRDLNASDLAKYSVSFPWPKRVPEGVYSVTVYECRNGTVVRHGEHSLPVIKIGLPARLSSLATEHATLYGIASVVAAMIMGFGIDLLIALFFGKRRETAH